MKFFSVVWVCYLLMLSCIPCTHGHEASLRADKILSAQTKSTGLETAPIESSRDHDEDHACSPFCACSCCGAHLSVPQALPPTIEPEGWHLLPVNRFSYSSPTWVAPPATIWQPPQLG